MSQCSNWCPHQWGGGWRCTRAVDASLGTPWWRCGGSCLERRTVFSSRPVCLWGDAAVAVLTRLWSASPYSQARSLWRYQPRHTNCYCFDANVLTFFCSERSWWRPPSWSTSSSSCPSSSTASVSAGNKSTPLGTTEESQPHWPFWFFADVVCCILVQGQRTT